MFNGLGLDRLVATLVGQASQRVQTRDPFFDSLLPWLGRMQQSVVERWRAFYQHAAPCAVPVVGFQGAEQCPEIAVGMCAACSEPACCHHAMAASNGDVLCLRCANEAVNLLRSNQRQRGYEPPPRRPRGADGAPPPSDDVEERKYLRELGLKPPTDWAEIQAAYKALLIKWHPDRAPADKRAKHEEKFKKVRAAYDWLATKYNKAA